jgi:hypothetical protein
VVGQDRPLEARLDAVRPCLVVPDVVPSVPLDVVRVGRLLDDRPRHRRLLALRTRAQTRVRGHALAGHRHLHWPADAVRGRVHRLDARDAAHPAVGRGRSHSNPDRRIRDNDQLSRGGGVWRDPWARTPLQRVEPRPPGAPLSAQARPPAARHTGRAALPSATFPHTLPADAQIPDPSGAAWHTLTSATGRPVTFD